ncbi:MAG: HD domain-containing phosphohydrolase [bacterium]
MESVVVQEPPEILVVDDEPIIRDVLTDLLTSQGYVVDTAENGAVALEKLQAKRYNLVISDLKMPVMGGADLLAALVDRQIKAMVIIMTAYATVETAIQTMKNGAYDYIMKPFKIDELLMVVERALEKDRLERENIHLREAQRLYQISEAMTSSLTLSHVLQIVLESARQEVEADAGSLVLWDEGKGRWHSEQVNVKAGGPREEEIEDLLDYEALRNLHASLQPVLLTPRDVQRFCRRPTDSGRQLQSVVSVPLTFRGEVAGMLNLFSFAPGRVFLEGQRKSMVVLAGRAASAVENARLHEELKELFLQTIEGFAFAIDAKDPYTLGHSRRVTRYAEWIAERIGLSEKEMQTLRHAATLHDIGKIGLRMESLNKPGKLTEEEIQSFRAHPEKGRKILTPIRFLADVVPAIYHHHERYDGKGYPDGKAGEAIPLGARILAIADSYDAMTSNRPYRKAMTVEQAMRELEDNAGTQFDPKIAAVFIQILRENRPEDVLEAPAA